MNERARDESAEGNGRAAAATLRELPSVNVLLERPALARLAARAGRASAVAAVQEALDDLRREVAGGRAVGDRERLSARAEALALSRARERRRSTLRRVINATGVVIHTNLGRSPLAPAAARAAARAARGYVTLEYELATGERGSRHVHAEALLRELTGAEAALVVNNAAAAVLLALNTAAAGKAVVVSRGELIEIGGGFRIPEVLAKSGARMVEVGTTNRTHLRDYASTLRELGTDIGAVLKVHRSNFVQSGFVAEVDAAELATLLRQEALNECAVVPLVYDLGSGCLVDLRAYGLPPEPTVRDAVASGAAFVAFSGDKLLGGPQAGVLLGRRDWIARARSNPLTRALRVDKLTLGALEATLRMYRDPARLERLPVLALLRRSIEDLREAARTVAAELSGIPGLEVEVVETDAPVGGGSLPGVSLRSAGVALRAAGLSPAELEERLRSGPTPVIARIVDERVVLDLRSVPERDLARLARCVRRALDRERRDDERRED